MGHYSAAAALAEEISAARPGAEVKIFDIYQAAFPGSFPMIYGAYSFLVERNCGLYNLAYRSVQKPRRARHFPTKKRQDPVRSLMARALARELAAFRPDAVVATYSLCARLMGEYKKTAGDPVPFVTCITDVTSHNVWINDECSLYLVAAESTAAELRERGVPPEKIAVSGIPVKRAFGPGGGQPGHDPAEGADRKAEKTAAGETTSSRRELLLMGGGLGLLPEDPEFYQRLNRFPGLHTTVVTGSNHKLFSRLQGRYENITVLGYSCQIPRLMAEADLLMTKPGGVTVFEAISAGLPLLLLKPTLAQETANADFVNKKALGLVLSKEPAQSLPELFGLLESPYLLKLIQRNMARLEKAMDKQALLRFLDSCAGRKSEAA
ncbi:MAG: glycosyltransferase [Bacillota bacterium]|nr:glycosyltransferase [Bacillota bacterium]